MIDCGKYILTLNYEFYGPTADIFSMITTYPQSTVLG